MDSGKPPRSLSSLWNLPINLVTADDFIPVVDLVMLAINTLNSKPRYHGSTKAYDAVLITSMLKQRWVDVKQHTVSLGVGKESKAKNSMIEISTETLVNGNGKCNECKLKHAKGKHLLDNKQTEIATLADSIIQKVQDSHSGEATVEAEASAEDLEAVKAGDMVADVVIDTKPMTRNPGIVELAFAAHPEDLRKFIITIQ
jgi:hypothetical protein